MEHTASVGRFNRTLDSRQDLIASSEPAVAFVLYLEPFMATASTRIRLFVVHDVHRGGREYMEDFVQVQFGEDAFVGVFDGHGGQEAAVYAKTHLWANIQAESGFCAKNSKEVNEAIVQGFLHTQEGMRAVRGESFVFLPFCPPRTWTDRRTNRSP